ncbi:MAG: hypothetical protein V4560_16790 [Bacteroidota bacterium]
MTLKTYLIFCFLFTCLCFEDSVCLAQKVKLSDLTKVELITSGSWMDAYYQKVEVVPKNGIWKSYQTKLFSNGYSRDRKVSRDSSKTFIREVPSSIVEQFISLAATPDPNIRDELFNIKTASLIAQIDSNVASAERFNGIRVFPSAEWKSQFIKAVSAKSVVSNALYNVLHPMKMDDRSHYYIITTDKFNKTDTITTDANGELYYLPWTINGKKSYNPNITKLFELMRGNDAFEANEQKNVYSGIITELYYYKTFKAKLDWGRFKAEQPDIYNKVSKTLIPLKFSYYNDKTHPFDMGYSGVFLSSQLPGYIELDGYFSKDHPNAVDFHNAQETRLVNWYKKGSFIFDYMERHPNAAMYFSPSIEDEIYAEVEKRYPDLAKFDKAKVSAFSIRGGQDYANVSLWFLLPDDKIILIRHGGKLADNYQHKFDIIPTKTLASRSTFVCLVFDKHGKKIDGSEDTFEVKLPQF